jgi:hypothetical protein
LFAALIIATFLDFGLGVLLVSVSGFVLQGVNNTGPMMPDAVFFVLMILLCVSAPIAAWFLRKRFGFPVVLAVAYSPLIVAGIALLVEPLFV